ncbi:MAG: acyltransferase [Bacteroidota bacterium]
MLRSLLIKIVRRKNPSFTLDPAVTSSVILRLMWIKFWAFARGFRILLAGKKPKMLLLGRGVQLFNTRNIQFGKWVNLEDGVYVSALGKRPIVFGNNVKIGAHSRVICATSFNHIGEHITIGDNVGLGEFAYLGGGGGLEIGSDCIIGQYLSCHPENHNYQDCNELIRHQGVTRKGIKIGSDCWIGAKVTVLDGVTVGKHCVIAAGAVVTKDMPDYSIIGGVPARVLKTIQPVEKADIIKKLSA